MSERAKLGFLCFLLLFMLGLLAFTAANTFQAVRSFQQQNSAVKTGDVSAIRPWMTIHVVSHVYHVPEDYLYRSLNVANPALLHHATLYDIASRKRQPVNSVIHSIQHTILTYRKEHPNSVTPTPQPHGAGRSRKGPQGIAPTILRSMAVNSSIVGAIPCGRPGTIVGAIPCGRPGTMVGAIPCGRPGTIVGVMLPCGRPGTPRRMNY